MRKNVLALAICMACIGIGQTAQAQTSDTTVISAALKKVVLENFDAYGKEDIFRVMATVHTQSPGYMATKQIGSQLFPTYDLKFELLDFYYLLTDKEYTLARAKQKTTKVSGPEFRDNVLDLIVVFRQENGEWKFWSQVILSVDYLN